MGVLYDVVTDSESLVQRVTQEAMRRKEEFLWQQFERHGFSREHVTDLLQEARITVVRHGKWEDYCVDGFVYFGVSNHTEEDGRVFTLECRDIIKPGGIEHVYSQKFVW